ncbi:MAG: sulfatase activating formylglycine-generating enzyme [Verrucomicrobiales bacterium]|jgi:formylglycine-generating enzyme required for sulfatase activity
MSKRPSVLSVPGSLLFLFTALGCIFPTAKGATTLDPDGQWNRFRWFGAEGSFESLEGPFNFTIPEGFRGTFDVTDAFEMGDKFEVTDNAAALGATSAPMSGFNFTDNPDLAFADSNWSSSRFPLSEGGHSIQIELVEFSNGQISGGAFLRLSLEELSTITWATPAPITYGNAITSNQLNASLAIGSGSGTFVYDPPIGTVLSTGDTQTLSVTYVPDNAAEDQVIESVEINVLPAPLTITADSKERVFAAANPALTASYTGFVNGDTPSGLDASVTISTTASLSSPVGTYSITPSSAADSNYTITFVEGILSVTNDSTVTVNWPSPESIVYGQALGTSQLSATVDGNIAGTFTYSPTIGTILDAGQNQILSVVFTPTDLVTHATVSATTTLSVLPVPLTIRADDQVGTRIQDSSTIPFVTIGDPNNAPFAQSEPFDRISLYGEVSEPYDIGKYEVTNELYTEFLNAVGKDDPVTAGQFDLRPPLYNGQMSSEARGGIVRSGEAPNFSYTVKPIMANKPVLFVSFWDVCRFCNWMHNGKPAGAQDATTTEDGAYDLMDLEAFTNNTVARKPGARYFIPSEDEWYKAAYYDPTKQAGYWNYPTRSDSIPEKSLADSQGNITNTTANVANFGRESDWDSNQNGTIENVLVFGRNGPEDGNVTSVGSGGVGSESYYGVADMAGNAAEWTEAAINIWGRIFRGGSWNGTELFLGKSNRIASSFTTEIQDLGFRIARPAGGGEQWSIPPLTVSYFGFVNGDTEASLVTVGTVSTDATGTSEPGTYPITVQGASSSNYEITFVPGSLFLKDKQDPSIQWATPQPIVYGTVLTETQLNATATSENTTVPGSFTYEPPLGTLLDAGSYELVAKFQPGDDQTYNLITSKVTLAVTKAPLSITVDSLQRAAGAENPTLSATYSEFTLTDSPSDLNTSLTLTTTATKESAPGVYPIIGQIGIDNNYEITVTNGTLTVAEKQIPVPSWIQAVNIAYGDFLTETQLNATTADALEGTWTYDPPIGTFLNAGVHELSAAFTPSNTLTHDVANASVMIEVTPAPLTIRATNHARPFGDSNPEFSFVYEGLTNGDEATATPPTLGTHASTESPAGEYAIRIENATDPNYSITLFDGTLTVLEPEILPFPEITVKHLGTEVVLQWHETARVKLTFSRDLIEWQDVDSAVDIVDGFVSIRYPARLVAEEIFEEFFYRLERTE